MQYSVYANAKRPNLIGKIGNPNLICSLVSIGYYVAHMIGEKHAIANKSIFFRKERKNWIIVIIFSLGQPWPSCQSDLSVVVSDWQYAKLAISLRVPGGGNKKKAPAAASDAGASAAQPDEEDDEYAGGLC